jgi:hypothetical protein
MYTDPRADFNQIRAETLPFPCRFCHEPAGFPCKNRRNGDVLTKFPAHLDRIREATK